MAPIRAASVDEAQAVASLHSTEIAEGFLSSLGEPFLSRLYRRVIADPRSFLLVSVGSDGRVEGFVAGTEDLGALYRSFVVRDGIGAFVDAWRGLIAGGRRSLETLSHAFGRGGDGAMPRAELLAYAVSPASRGKGVGRSLVDAFIDEMRSRGVPSSKIVVAEDNAASLKVVQAAGFRFGERHELHRGRSSWILVWP